ncbi:hypothetical protein NDU88_004405 [Pleurodeles waltl]|uniref:Uncharacterized protein n=1 Tax=Pleurodeles waltl TaxID=8319 RepID=A0AAV7RLI1_PLEWA|nr:hypothetical protein NDU88_004405 [Pleurodeles waltl]
MLRRPIWETLLKMRASGHPNILIPGQPLQSSGSDEEVPGPDEQKCKYIAHNMLPDLIWHVKVNDEEVPDTTSGSLLLQFLYLVPLDVPVHPYIHEDLKREGRDPEKIMLLSFKANLNSLQDMWKDLPVPIPSDSFVANGLCGCSLELDPKRLEE